MTGTQTRRYEMFVRVRDFGKAHEALFPESTGGGKAFAAVAAAVARLSEHTASRGAQRGTGARVAARQALLERLDAIVRTARVIAEEVPRFDEPFSPPKRRGDQSIVASGRLFLRHMESSKEQFISNGMPDTCVTDLAALVDSFEQAVLHGQAGKNGQAAAQVGIEEAFDAGRKAIRKLDVIVPNQLQGDREALAVWELARTLEKSRRAKSAAVEPAPAPPSTTPPAPAVTPAPVLAAMSAER